MSRERSAASAIPRAPRPLPSESGAPIVPRRTSIAETSMSEVSSRRPGSLKLAAHGEGFTPAEVGLTHGAQSLKRAAMILRFLSSRGRRGAALKDVAFESGLHKATAHRMLRALVDERLVECDPISHRYRLGGDIFSLAVSMGDHFDIRQLARPSLERLAQATEDTVYLGVRSQFDGLCIDMIEGSHPEQCVTLRPYDRWPLGVGAFALAILAYMPDADVAATIRRNAPRLLSEPHYTPEKLLEAVAKTRRDGFATAYNTLFHGGCGIAVPVLDQQDRPIASLCVLAVLPRMGEGRQKEVAALMWRESQLIGEAWRDTYEADGSIDSWKNLPSARPDSIRVPNGTEK
jgi:DNA-binding IclR family transcriptional regulator